MDVSALQRAEMFAEGVCGDVYCIQVSERGGVDIRGEGSKGCPSPGQKKSFGFYLFSKAEEKDLDFKIFIK